MTNEYIQFSLSKEESAKAVIWVKNHDCIKRGKPTGAIGGGITYELTPTSIGLICVVKCWCGQKIDITEYETW
jgi:hypothetical protein